MYGTRSQHQMLLTRILMTNQFGEENLQNVRWPSDQNAKISENLETLANEV